MNCKIDSEDKVFFVNHWLSKSKRDIYVFTKDTKAFNKDNLKTKGVNDVIVLQEQILSYDTIRNVLFKISKHIKSATKLSDCYYWYSTVASNIEKNNFIKTLYDESILLEPHTVNTLCKYKFDLTGDIVNNNLKYVKKGDLRKALIDKELQMYNEFSFNIRDPSDSQFMYPINPFGDKDSIFTMKNTPEIVSNENMLIGDIMNNVNTINLITKEHFPRHTFYFDKITIHNSDMKTYEKLFDFQKVVEATQFKDKLDEFRCNILKFHATFIPHRVCNINLNDVFNFFESVPNIPLIAFKSHNNILFKGDVSNIKALNYKVVSNIQKQAKNMIGKERARDKSNIRKYTSIMFYVIIDETNFCNVVLSETGMYNVFINMNQNNNISIANIKAFLSELKFFKNNIHEDIYVMCDNDDMFMNRNIAIKTFTVRSAATLMNVDKSMKKIINSLNALPHIFSGISRAGAEVSLRFKLVSNYIESSDILLFVNDNIDESEDNIIDSIMSEYGKTEEEAREEYTNAKLLLMSGHNKKFNNKIVESIYNSGVNIVLKMDTNNELLITMDNMKHASTSEHIIKFVLFALLNTTTDDKVKTALSKVVELNDKNTQSLLNQNQINNEDSDVEDDDADGDDDEEEEEEDDFMFSDDIFADANEADSDGATDADGAVDANPETPSKSVSSANSDDGLDDFVDEKKDNENEKDYEKRRHKRYILEELKRRDKELFDFKPKDGKNNYARVCQASGRKQPVVITKAEKAIIDKNHEGSYTGFVQTGSTEELRLNHYYICPRYWCPISRVSLTEEQLARGCPKNEQVLQIFQHKRTPYFLKPLHPNNFQLPCCSTTKLTKKQEEALATAAADANTPADANTLDSKYIHNHDTLLTKDKYGALPPKLQSILNQSNKCIGNTKNRECFVRRGMEQTDPRILENVFATFLTQHSDINTLVKKNLKPEHFVLMKGGYNIRAYYNPEKTIEDDDEEYAAFEKWLTASKTYAKMFNIDTADLLKKDRQNPEIIRQYIVFNAYTNFMEYFESDVVKTYDDLASLMIFPWFNPNNSIVLLIKDIANISYLQVPYHFNIMKNVSHDTTFFYVFEKNNTYEPIVRLSDINHITYDEIMSNTIMINNMMHSIDENTRLKSFQDTYFKIALEHTVKSFVIDNNFKCCGFILDTSNIFIPLNGYYELSIPNMDITSMSIVYLDQLNAHHKPAATVSIEDIQNLYKELDVPFELSASEDAFTFKDLDFVYLTDGEFNDYSLYSLIQLNDQHENTKFVKTLYDIMQSNDASIDEMLYYLKHELNPMPEQKKISALENKLKVPRDIAEGLFRFNYKYVKHLLSKSKMDDKNILVLSETSIFEEEGIIKIYNKRMNPYSVFTHSYDDFKTSKTIKLNVILKEIDSIKHKQIFIHNDDVKGDILPPTVKSDLFGKKATVQYNTIMPAQYTSVWVISYLAYVSKLLNRNIITYEGMMKRIKNTIIRSYNKGGDERKNMMLFFNKNRYAYKRPTKDLDDVMRIVESPDYCIGLYEFEIVCEYMDINCVVISKTSSTFVKNIYYFNANSDVFMMFNSVRSVENTHDEYYPIIRYKDGAQQYLYHESELPKNINERIR